MAGIPTGGRLTIEIVAQIASLQQDLDRAKRAVGAMSSDIARSAKSANDNLAGIANGARSYSASITQLKTQLDPAWAAQVRFNEAQRVGMMAFRVGAIDRQQFITHMRTISAELKGLDPIQARATAGVREMHGSMGLARGSSMELGHVIRAMTDSIAAGQSPVRAFSMEIGRISQVVGMSASGTGAFAAFLGGPWFLAISAATAVLLPFIASLFDTNEEAKKGKVVHRDFIDVLRDGKSAWGEITKAAAEYAQQQSKSRELTLTQIKDEAALSAAVLVSAMAIRQKLAARLASDLAEQSGQGVGAGYNSALAQRISDTSSRLTANEAAIKSLSAAATEAAIKAADMIAKLNSDPLFKIATGFDVMRDAARKAYLASHDYDALTKSLTDLDRQERALNETHKESLQYGREINTAQARSIASGAGFRVTSGQRTMAEQQWLYDHKRTAENPVAFPNANAPHIRGNALDIAFGAGVTVESVRKAYADAGVHLSKILKETGHFHIEWSTTGADKAERETERLAHKHEIAAKRAADAWQKFQKLVADSEFSATGSLISTSAAMQKRFGSNFNAQGDADMADMTAKMNGPKDEEIARVNKFGDAMARLKDIAGTLNLADAFGRGGSAIDSMVSSLDRLKAAQEAHGAAIFAAGKNQGDIAKADKAYSQAKLNGTIAILHSSKQLFNQQSGAYKAIDALEKIAAARALVNTAIHVANGAAKIFGSLGPFAFPVVAAMLAVMAGLGFKGGGSAAVAPPTAKDLQEAAGTGSVLGDSKGKSDSIAKSLDIVASNTNHELEYSNEMVKALHSIDGNISKLAGNIARQISVSGSLFDTSNQKLGQSGSSGFLGLFASSTTRSLYDVGLSLVGAKVSDILAKGIQGQTYQVVEQIKKKSGFLGIGGGTKTTYETTNGAIDPGISKSIQDVVGSLKDGLISAANVFGIEGAGAIIDNFKVEIGKISFKDLTGAEIEKQLNAIFSKLGDDMAGAILPSLAQIQKVGEGLFETFTRVAREYQVVDVSLRAISMTFGTVGVESIAARDGLVQLFGSLDSFVTATNFYRDNFLTEAERIAPVMKSVADEMARLNLTGVDTIDRFKAVVSGIDLTTQAGRELFAALMQVAPAFSTVEKYQQKLADQAVTDAAKAAAAVEVISKQRYGMEITLLELTGDKVGALAMKRAQELSAMDASLRPLQQQIYLQQDIASARDVLNASYQRERSEITATVDKYTQMASSLRDLRASLEQTVGGSGSYQSALASLKSTGALAGFGSESAVSALSGVVNTFLGEARNHASTSLDYRRDVARAGGYVDSAISATSGLASEAQRQLAALDNSVKGLVTVNDSVVTVHDAVTMLQDLLASPTLSIADDTAKARAEDKQSAQDMLTEMRGMRDEARISASALKAPMDRLAGSVAAFTRGDRIAVMTDGDILQTHVVV
jgi:hypothetical protein